MKAIANSKKFFLTNAQFPRTRSHMISMPPSKVCPQCKAECVLLVSAVQGFCCFCSLPQARSQDFEGEVSAGGAHAHCICALSYSF